MNYSIVACIVSSVLLAILLVKNELVWRATGKAIDKLYSQKNWEELRDKYPTSENYHRNVWHPLKWTYSQMFKELSQIK